jgi:hypothetical protein
VNKFILLFTWTVQWKSLRCQCTTQTNMQSTLFTFVKWIVQSELIHSSLNKSEQCRPSKYNLLLFYLCFYVIFSGSRQLKTLLFTLTKQYKIVISSKYNCCRVIKHSISYKGRGSRWYIFLTVKILNISKTKQIIIY